jgi:7-dehydrocholesterol reductase
MNAIPAVIVTHVLLYMATYQFGLFRASLIYDALGEMLATLVPAAFVLCLLLQLKGYYAPDAGSDADSSGSLLFDFYFGVELYPTVFGMNLKQLVNSRLSMMAWALIMESCAAKQYELTGQVSYSMMVSVGLHLVYLWKFFLWEGGYFRTIDVMHDRCGYYIMWGLFCWVPSVYTLVAQYLVHGDALDLNGAQALALFAVGLYMIYVNYEADWQRQYVRDTQGQAEIWGQKPRTLLAHYTTEDGQKRTNLLLASGWWGVARHFNYDAELALTFFWTLPVGFHNALPWFYMVFLTILLFDRSGRDELRCAAKYGRHWTEFTALVPYRWIPGVF